MAGDNKSEAELLEEAARKSGIEPAASRHTGTLSTDDLEKELVKRRVNRGLGWKHMIATAAVTAVTAWAPNVANWIDAQTEKTRHTVIVDQVVKERVSNEKSYERLAATINEHTDELKQLQACQADVTTLKEWRLYIDRSLKQKLNIRVVAPIVTVESDSASAKILVKRPQAADNDPRVQSLKAEFKEKGAY